MAHFNNKVEDEFAIRSNMNYPGEWKRIPRWETDILLHLPPGTYLLQNAGLIQTNIGLTGIIYPKLLRQRLHFDYFLAADKPEETKRLAEIQDVVGKVNAKIEQLVGLPDGGNDPGLKELYMNLGGLIARYYDSYMEVPRDTVWDNNRECMGIVIERPEPGLLYSNAVEVVNQIGRKLAISAFPIEQLSSQTAPTKVQECSVKLQRLEFFIPKRQMDTYWKRWNSADQQQGNQEMPKPGCSVMLQRLEKCIPKKHIRVHWNQYWDTTDKQQGKKQMPECSVKLQRLETFIPEKQMDFYWKRWNSDGQQKK